jgi:thiol-disulfide isomerase/thioredoxin
VYTTDSIPKNKATVIIYFSPDCSHCQYEAKQIVKGQAELQNATFIWVSFHPLPEIISFKSQYGMDSFSNMVFARDPKYFLPAFYKVAFTPYMAVYNAQGQFVKEFREGAEIKELKELINN